jgi:DNA polymerase III subunit delta'
MFDTIIGQEIVKATLASILRSEKIPHAMLFAGPYGTGKGESAIAFAAALLCEQGAENACGQCSGCRRAMRLEHPDLHLLFPFRAAPDSVRSRDEWTEELVAQRTRIAEEQYAPVSYDKSLQIAKALVSETRDRLLETSFEGGRKVCVILQAERLNATTANSLLKIIEEPPAGVYFILTTERASSVLPTIASRCSVFRFRRLTAGEIAQSLTDTGKLDREQAVLCAQAAGGSMKTAKSLAFENRGASRELAGELYHRASHSTGAVFETALEHLWSRDSGPAEELLEGFMHFTTRVLEEKYGIHHIATPDQPLSALARAVKLRDLDQLARRFEEGLEMLGRNVAVSAVLTSTLYGIYETYNHG